MNFSLFEKIISINSIYPNEKELAEYLTTYLIEHDFAICKIPILSQYREGIQDDDRYNIVATKGSGSKKIIFYAHMDTVPIHDQALRQTNPHLLTQDKSNPDIYYGLGSVDMKGGLRCILEATKDISLHDYTIVVIFGCDEECWSKGSWSLIEHSEIFSNALCMIVPEIGTSTSTNPLAKHCILGRRGRILIQIEVPGKSCHGALSATEGVNAITQASLICCELEKRKITNSDGVLPAGTHFVKTFTSTVSSLSVPDTATIVIDRHTIIGETQESVIQEYHNFIENLYRQGMIQKIPGREIRISLAHRPTPMPMAYHTDPSLPILSNIEKAILTEYPSVEYGYGYSIADENVFATLGIPIIILGPVGGHEHSANERVSRASLEKLVAIYKSFLFSL